MKVARLAPHLSVLIGMGRSGCSGMTRGRGHGTAPAIAWQIDAREACLGATLLIRSTSALGPADAAQVMFDKA
jgi:DNA-binding transcriptional LysR family regulator